MQISSNGVFLGPKRSNAMAEFLAENDPQSKIFLKAKDGLNEDLVSCIGILKIVLRKHPKEIAWTSKDRLSN